MTEEEKWRTEFEELGPAEVRRLINVFYWREGQHNAALRWLHGHQSAEPIRAKALRWGTFGAAVAGAITILIALLLK
jgi:hypothetical protein